MGSALKKDENLTESAGKVLDVTKSVVVIYHLSVKTCGRGGTADALASGASGGNLVVVQIHSTAPKLNDEPAILSLAF